MSSLTKGQKDYIKHKDKIKQYKKNNAVKIRAYHKKYNRSYRNQNKECLNKGAKKRRDELSDSYIVVLLRAANIPATKKMIELKRQLLLLKRLIKTNETRRYV